MAADKSRPPTPPDVALQLRKEAGFGCCKCGRPIYQYHHIVPWDTDQHFRCEDMMILCPLHHDEATKGAMRPAEQRKHKANPHNIREGMSNGVIKTNHEDCMIRVGPAIFRVDGPILMVDGETLISLSVGPDGILEFSMSLYDRGDNNILNIENNEWKTEGSLLPWDIQSDWSYLKIRERRRHVLFEIDARKDPPELSINCWRKGVNIKLQPRLGVWVGAPIKAQIKGSRYIDNLIIGVDTNSRQLQILRRNMDPAVVMNPGSKVIFEGPYGIRSVDDQMGRE